jgi:hypothetical protein
MHRVVLPILLLAPACAPTEGDPSHETWVRATIDGAAYEQSSGLALLHVDWSPNHIQMFSGLDLSAVLFGWEGDEYQLWKLIPITGEGTSGVFWTDADTHQWMSISGYVEFASFEENPLYGGADRRIGWAEGTFQATLEDVDPYEYRTLEVTGGDFRVVLRHGEGA